MECISIFIPRVFESQFIKIKTGKNKYILVGNIYRPNSAPHANIKYFNQSISDIFSKIKSDPNVKNVNEAILVGDKKHKFIKLHKFSKIHFLKIVFYHLYLSQQG